MKDNELLCSSCGDVITTEEDEKFDGCCESCYDLEHELEHEE